eukprot:TRINITY_DN258_c0_g1_i2.p1 TRINITY_DN258_c0_g1~~TRINITY_DN258_c0_g1_i2.p1  ORF type:complete len:391 (+),score=74.07 TRINITY_DN258_c0_g1_i2:134-1306(+)
MMRRGTPDYDDSYTRDNTDYYGGPTSERRKDYGGSSRSGYGAQGDMKHHGRWTASGESRDMTGPEGGDSMLRDREREREEREYRKGRKSHRSDYYGGPTEHSYSSSSSRGTSGMGSSGMGSMGMGSSGYGVHPAYQGYGSHPAYHDYGMGMSAGHDFGYASHPAYHGYGMSGMGHEYYPYHGQQAYGYGMSPYHSYGWYHPQAYGPSMPHHHYGASWGIGGYNYPMMGYPSGSSSSSRGMKDLTRKMDNMGMPGSMRPEIDIQSTEQDWVIEMDLPGFSRENVDLKFASGDVLEIVAKPPQSDSNIKYMMQERKAPTYFRRVHMPPGTDGTRINAVLQNGILRVSVPRTGGVTTTDPSKGMSMTGTTPTGSASGSAPTVSGTTTTTTTAL